MGRDIHIWLEQKRPAYYQVDHWELLASEVSVVRDYSLFHVLAYRDEDTSQLPSLGEPRGLPADIAPVTAQAADEWGTDGHSRSFLTYEDWRVMGRALPAGFDPALTPACPSSDDDRIIAARVDTVPVGPNVDLAAIIAYLAVYHNGGHLTRMVFWFDN